MNVLCSALRLYGWCRVGEVWGKMGRSNELAEDPALGARKKGADGGIVSLDNVPCSKSIVFGARVTLNWKTWDREPGRDFVKNGT